MKKYLLIALFPIMAKAQIKDHAGQEACYLLGDSSLIPHWRDTAQWTIEIWGYPEKDTIYRGDMKQAAKFLLRENIKLRKQIEQYDSLFMRNTEMWIKIREKWYR